MFEKVSKYHPDKIADRIAGALVDYAYSQQKEPKVAIEVLIGHGHCHIIGESSVNFPKKVVKEIVERIGGNKIKIDFKNYAQDKHLAGNQAREIRCGDNGIFKGSPLRREEKQLTQIVKELDIYYKSDGKCILSKKELIVCQSNATGKTIKDYYSDQNKFSFEKVKVNPLGDWTGGTNVDTGATNRKLGSDMGDSVTGGGLHGKDLSKADVSVNVYAWIKAQQTNEVVELHCAIGDKTIDNKPYKEIVKIAKQYIDDLGGFEKFAEYGLVK